MQLDKAGYRSAYEWMLNICILHCVSRIIS